MSRPRYFGVPPCRVHIGLVSFVVLGDSSQEARLGGCSVAHSTTMATTITLAIGNTHRFLPNDQVTYDRSDRKCKVHEIILYVDILIPDQRKAIVEALENTIDRVTFDWGSTFKGSPFICYSPIPAKNHGYKVWRFQARCTAYESVVTATIEVRGVAGKGEKYEHSIVWNSNANRYYRKYEFTEARKPRPLRMIPLASDMKFGVELECTTSKALEDIQRDIPFDCQIIRVHSQGKQNTTFWKLVPDSSITCNINNPNCTTFELVSPVLKGGDGLNQIHKICFALKHEDTQVNKSAGFHVHINVEQYSLEQIIKICQQYIKYESVFDRLMPPSRRTGSAESNTYFKSNRDSVGKFLTPEQRNQALASCTSMEALARLMNAPGTDRYYKLNLQNLRTGRQPTIEFRQHSATMNYDKISGWVRLCSRFCFVSAKSSPPTSFLSNKGNHQKFQALFWYVVKDRALKDLYKKRQMQVVKGDADEASCCSACAKGGVCRRTKLDRTL